MNPIELNKISQSRNSLFVFRELNQKFIYGNQTPIAIEPDFSDKRLYAQEGKFVLFGKDWHFIEWYEALRSEKVIRKILISKNLCKNIFKELYSLGYNYRRIYPDEEGYVKDLNYELKNTLISMDKLEGGES